MAEKILMTALSPTMEEGTIVSWSKKEGDTVGAGDVLCEVETDKATMDYEATQEGTLLKIVLQEGSGAKVGETIGIIGEEGEDYGDLLKEKAPTDKPKKSTDSGEDSQKDNEPADDDKPKEETKQVEARGSSAPKAAEDSGRVKASPLARRLAEDKGVDLSQISGSGPGGRIVKDDVENYTPSRAAASGASVGGAPSAAMPSQDRETPVSSRRAIIAKRLAESKFGAPHYYLKSSINMSEVIRARNALNKSVPEKVSFNAFLMKFAAEAIKRHPVINSSWQGDTIREYASIDIGLAVDVGAGLITPIVRNCGSKGVKEIDAELVQLIDKARSNTLKPEEYTGATFSISNLGSFGVDEFTAIINPPGSAILAVGRTKKTPVVDEQNDGIMVQPMMTVTLSCDHRVIDGAAGGRFLHELSLMMQEPFRVLF
ncbi:MAG: pyruvate dehydrogenase complex dihydrolipoamide acetyltransferase [Spirochaetaceae bacterium]|nr:MAG: pyruvate dehydrogenase complex dihydrolipoamide acetyltransferase [Spirochaetaceae bacterium]